MKTETNKNFLLINHDYKFKKFKKENFNLAMVDGGFDPLHDGHIRYFKKLNLSLKSDNMLFGK